MGRIEACLGNLPMVIRYRRLMENALNPAQPAQRQTVLRGDHNNGGA
jgi:hypothetical protein